MKNKTLLLILCTGVSLVVSSRADGLLFPTPPQGLIPFNPYRTNVYDAHELLAECATNFDTNTAEAVYQSTLDWRYYTNAMNPANHHPRTDLPPTTRRYLLLHDFAVESALDNYLKPGPDTNDWKKVVSIMGGHDLPRQDVIMITNGTSVVTNDATYMQVALLAQRLSTNGFTIVTGGGPGAMEAANLGAWFADRSEVDLRTAVRQLMEVPVLLTNNTGRWLMPAFKVIRDFPHAHYDSKTESVGVPTWFYGQEPPNPFATHIAKYFNNSLREEHLLAVAGRGIVFARGNAGTVQEIFQDACQNYYNNYLAYRVPMILLDTDYWNRKSFGVVEAKAKPVWPLLEQIASERGFTNRLLITDDINAITNFIMTSKP